MPTFRVYFFMYVLKGFSSETSLNTGSVFCTAVLIARKAVDTKLAHTPRNTLWCEKGKEGTCYNICHMMQ